MKHTQHKQFKLKEIARGVILACGAMAVANSPQLLAEEKGAGLEEVIVTAQRVRQNVQDVPISMTVLGETQLENLGMTTLEDFVQMLPNISYIAFGPSSGDIYMRGISSGGESLNGSQPSVAIYFDEQPVTALTNYLNPHVYDIAQIETLAGPQGTLFGSNAQSGAIRFITNQPDPSGFKAGYDLEVNSVKSGDAGYLAEGFVNIPLGERAAIRLVGWYKDEGGYIDNVPGTLTIHRQQIRDMIDADLASGARFSDTNFTKPGELKVKDQDEADRFKALAVDRTWDNSEFVEKNFNTAETVGFRAKLKYDISDTWTITAGVMAQDVSTEGVWDHDPFDVGDLQVNIFQPSSLSDEWIQYSFKIEGEIGAGITLLYTANDLDRDYKSQIDYSSYSDVLISGFNLGPYDCPVEELEVCSLDSRMPLDTDSDLDRTSHEIRLASSQDQRFRWLLGAFFEENENIFNWDWRVPGLAAFSSFQPDGNPVPGGRAIEPEDVWWTTDMERTGKDRAFYGQVTYDFTDQLTGSFSIRDFNIRSSLKGFSGSNINGLKTRNRYTSEGKSKDKDQVVRASLKYNFSDDVMVFATFAEGFRPGGVNRVDPQVAGIGFTYDADFLTSYEVGIKSTLLDGRLRLNAVAYMQDWEDFQQSALDPDIANISLTLNIANATSDGIEADFTYMLTDAWSVSGALAYNQAEVSEDFFKNENLRGIAPPDAPKGTDLPRSPDWKWNLSTRYHFTMFGRNSFFQGSYSFTGESYSDLFTNPRAINSSRKTQDSYQIANVAIGMELESYDVEVELFIRNVFDERGEVFINGFSHDTRVTTNRPRQFGIRFRQRF